MKTIVKKRFVSIAAMATFGVVPTGCATYNNALLDIEKTEKKISSFEQENHEIKVDKKGNLVFFDNPYLLGKKISISDSEVNELLSQNIFISSASPMSIGEIAMFITKQTNIPVIVSPSILARNKGRLGNKSSVDNKNAESKNLLPLILPAPLMGGAGLASEDSLDKIVINYSGTLRGLLDTVAAQTQTFWKYKNGEIHLFLTETRVFEVNALPGKIKMQNKITNDGASGSGGGNGSGQRGGTSQGTSQNASVDIDLDPYKSIEESIKTVLKQSGASNESVASVTVDPSSGQVVVTATPLELEAVEEYIRNINAQMNKNVLVEVNVYSVAIDDSVDASAALNLSLAKLIGGGVRSLELTNPPIVTSTGTVTAGIVSGNLAVEAVLSALSKVGRTSLVTSGSVIALNGRPSPIQFSKNEGYLASVTSNTIANAGVSTTLEPGTVVSGFSGTFLPLVRGDRIFLEYAISLSKNLGFTSESSGGNKINLPNTTLQTINNRVSVKDGDTIVLASFEQEGNDANKIFGTTAFGLVGGKQKTATVITMRVVNMGGR